MQVTQRSPARERIRVRSLFSAHLLRAIQDSASAPFGCRGYAKLSCKGEDEGEGPCPARYRARFKIPITPWLPAESPSAALPASTRTYQSDTAASDSSSRASSPPS